PRRTFQAPHAGVAVQPDDEQIAERSRFGQVADMAHVQQIEAAVGEHDLFASGAMLGGQPGQLVERKSFGARNAEPGAETIRSRSALACSSSSRARISERGMTATPTFSTSKPAAMLPSRRACAAGMPAASET